MTFSQIKSIHNPTRGLCGALLPIIGAGAVVGQPQLQSTLDDASPVWSVAFSPDSRRLATGYVWACALPGSADHRVRIYVLGEGAPPATAYGRSPRAGWPRAGPR